MGGLEQWLPHVKNTGLVVSTSRIVVKVIRDVTCPQVLYYSLMQIMCPPIWEGNLYPIYFHVLYGESSERHWGKYDDSSFLSQPLFKS